VAKGIIERCFGNSSEISIFLLFNEVNVRQYASQPLSHITAFSRTTAAASGGTALAGGSNPRSVTIVLSAFRTCFQKEGFEV
jgi:hypothetical protein